MTHKPYQLLQEEAHRRYEASLEGKPKPRRGRSRQRAPHEHKGWQPRQDAREHRTNNRRR